VFAATRDHHEAEDILQEVWRVLCAKLEEYDETRPLRQWALGIARLQVLKWRQSKARSREVLAPDILEMLADTAQQCAAEIDMRAQFLRACMAELTLLTRRILRMKYFDGLKTAAIATKTGRTTPSIEMRLVRGRRELRSCVERKMGGEGTGISWPQT
jgi:RNA polymerase sigma-70 factor (ECF subfamily)